jgi:hypothetical protein
VLACHLRYLSARQQTFGDDPSPFSLRTHTTPAVQPGGFFAHLIALKPGYRLSAYDQAGVAVDGRGLNGCDLVLAQALAGDVEAGGKPGRGSKLTAPDLERLARTPWPKAFSLELRLGPLMLERGGAGLPVEAGKFRPGV